MGENVMIRIFLACAEFCVLLLAVLVLACLVRAVRGPRITDRIVACNMIGTMTICIIAILGTVMEQSWLYDICLIYAMISFLAVVVLSCVYTGAYRMRKRGHSIPKDLKDFKDFKDLKNLNPKDPKDFNPKDQKDLKESQINAQE